MLRPEEKLLLIYSGIYPKQHKKYFVLLFVAF